MNPLKAILLLIGFWVVIVLIFTFAIKPKPYHSTFPDYPDYEEECVPNFMGGCDIQ